MNMGVSLDNHKQQIIKRIAQNLEAGFTSFYNVKTEEIIDLPGVSYGYDEDEFEEVFKESLIKIEDQKQDIIKFEVPKSFQLFEIMELFVAQLSDSELKSELEIVLTNRKPFQHFKYRIDHSEFRQNWFHFRASQLEKRVAEELKTNKLSAKQWINGTVP